MHELCDALLRHCSEIPKEDLARVVSTLRAYLGKDALPEKNKDVAIRYSGVGREVIDTLFAYARSKGIPVPRKFSRGAAFTHYEANIAAVAKWASGEPKVARLALYFVGVRLLHRYLLEGVPVRWHAEKKFLTRAKLPVGFQELLIFIDRIPAVVDASFPGYKEAGLLSKIVSRRGYS